MPSPAERISESSMTDLWNLWFTEQHRRRVGLTIKIKQLLYTAKSPYQRIDVLDSYEFGRMLVLYGSIMLTAKDAFAYHETLPHVPPCAPPNPERARLSRLARDESDRWSELGVERGGGGSGLFAGIARSEHARADGHGHEGTQ